jgi:hypothetical protein
MYFNFSKYIPKKYKIKICWSSVNIGEYHLNFRVPFKGLQGIEKCFKFCISALGSCAHVRELHRFQQGPFLEEDMLDSDEWTFKNILIAIQKAKEAHGRFLKRSTKKHKYDASLST